MPPAPPRFRRNPPESLNSLTLILGGAASGKSAYAEGIFAALGPAVYLATGEAGDGEMAAKIARHRARRGEGWRTVEVPVDLPGVLVELPPEAPVLIDCATLWLSNLMGAGIDWAPEAERLVGACDGRGPTVIVSNEIGMGLVPDTALGRAFREAQGALNARLAEAAGSVVFVVAGLPLVLR